MFIHSIFLTLKTFFPKIFPKCHHRVCSNSPIIEATKGGSSSLKLAKKKKKNKTEKRISGQGKNVIHHFHINHNEPCLTPPPRILHNHFSNFSLVLQSSQEKSKTMVVQFFSGKRRCIMEYVKVVYVPMATPMSIKHRSQQIFIFI